MHCLAIIAASMGVSLQYEAWSGRAPLKASIAGKILWSRSEAMCPSHRATALG